LNIFDFYRQLSAITTACLLRFHPSMNCTLAMSPVCLHPYPPMCSEVIFIAS
jgi:hypothetical protein